MWPNLAEEPDWDPTVLWNNTGWYAWAVGRAPEARVFLEEALSVRRRVLGEDHPDTLTSMNNLANDLWALGDASGARELHEEALSIRRRVLGEEHPSTLSSLHNLCVTLDESDNMELDRQLVEALLTGVRK